MRRSQVRKDSLDHLCHDYRDAGLNNLRQHVTEHPAGGYLAAGWKVTHLK
ncbi:MAG: hypothetical protein NTV33_07190 [Coprothermobacterota bacterium]|nr:hypothetical protein [Coprothermobacterota bacterium]